MHKKIIKKLKLKPLKIEGGFFRRTHSGKTGSCILFLITKKNFSRLHKISKTEIFFYHSGGPAVLTTLSKTGKITYTILGPNPLRGHAQQIIVPPNTWQSLSVAPRSKTNWTLVSTAVLPSFQYKDFMRADGAQLIRQFPKLKNMILNLG